jgi:hypothetical protein
MAVTGVYGKPGKNIGAPPDAGIHPALKFPTDKETVSAYVITLRSFSFRLATTDNFKGT